MQEAEGRPRLSSVYVQAFIVRTIARSLSGQAGMQTYLRYLSLALSRLGKSSMW